MTRRPTTSQRIELRHGRWEDVLADVEVDAVITDPPYGERTHAGHNDAFSQEKSMKAPRLSRRGTLAGGPRTPINFQHLTPEDVAAFVSAWSPRTRGWMACMTSHDLIPAWEQAYADAGRCSFAPVPIVIPGMSVRVAGDGPSSWSVYLMVARPRSRAFATWGTLPGAYYQTRTSEWQNGGGGGRGKPLDLMRAIVSDYSRPGDLVCDPCSGYGSTLAAALQKGRRGIGAELDEAVYHEAQRRLAGVQYVDLFDQQPKTKRPQGALEL